MGGFYCSGRWVTATSRTIAYENGPAGSLLTAIVISTITGVATAVHYWRRMAQEWANHCRNVVMDKNDDSQKQRELKCNALYNYWNPPPLSDNSLILHQRLLSFQPLPIFRTTHTDSILHNHPRANFFSPVFNTI